MIFENRCDSCASGLCTGHHGSDEARQITRPVLQGGFCGQYKKPRIVTLVMATIVSILMSIAILLLSL